MKFTKRLASLAMGVVMSAALTVPAFAATTNTETTITGSYTPITIEVVVPTTGTAQINPYGLPLDVAKSNSTKVSFTGHKIFTGAAATIKNKMNTDLSVNVSVTGAITALPDGSTATPMRFASEPIAADTTAKSAFVYAQFKASTATGADDGTLADALIDEYSGWAVGTYDAAKDVLVKAGTESKEGVVVLKKATMDTAANGGGFKEYAAGSIALVRLSGSVVASPKEAWSTDDGFTAKIAYTFVPVA